MSLVSAGVRFPGRGWVFRQVGLEIYKSDTVALVGPSGAGKSTALGLLALEFQPDEGTVTRSIEPAQIGFIHQTNPILPRRTVAENVAMGCRTSRTEVTRSFLEQVGLEDRAGALAGRLSGGEIQRLCIARVLAQQPRLILADEPTGNLDHANSVHIGTILSSISTSAVVIATHDRHIGDLFNRVIDVSSWGKSNGAPI